MWFRNSDVFGPSDLCSRAATNNDTPFIAELVPTGPMRRGRPPKDPNQTPADIRERARQRARKWNREHKERVKEIKRVYRRRLRGDLGLSKNVRLP